MSGYQYTPWIWPLLASAAFIGAVGAYLWRRRDTPGATPLFLAVLVMSLWCLANAAEISALEFETQRAWFLVRDALAAPGVVAALWFALEYAGFTRFLTRPVVAVLIASVLIHMPLYVIDDGRLLWTRVWWDEGVRADLAPLGTAFTAYGFGLFVLVTAIFVILFVRSPAHRMPVGLILLGQVSVRLAYPLGALNIAEYGYVPPIILAFDFATAMYAVALFRFRMFDLVPVARETIIDRMPDAMFVVDAGGRIADLNDAAARLVGARRAQVLGRPVTAALDRFPEIAERILDDPPGPLADALITTDAGERRCQVSTSELADWQGRPIGRLVLVHDITELRLAQERVLEHERALAIAREREQMARDLHDRVGQVLGYVSLQADASHKLLSDARRAEAGRQLQRLASVAREAHADVRGYIQELHDAAPEGRPLVEMLRRELDRFSRSYGIEVSLSARPPQDGAGLGPEAETQLFRIVQEALSNARRHGGARHISVGLEADEAWGRLVIEDDGAGFDARAQPVDDPDRHGLRFMRERVAGLSGELEIHSSPGQGTRVVVRVPVGSNGNPGARHPERDGGHGVAPTGAGARG